MEKWPKYEVKVTLNIKICTSTSTLLRGGDGGAIFLTSDDHQIFFGALYHEMVRTSPEHKGSDHFLPWTPELLVISEVSEGEA